MSQIVLLHGSWLGGWAWGEVAPLLEQHGHDVLAPDFGGQGGLFSHRDELLTLIDKGQIRPGATVVAHSYAGMPATATAVERPGAFSRLIYLDAYVPRAEQSAFDILPDIKAAFEGIVTEDRYVPPLPVAAFGITDPEVVRRIESRLRPWPLISHTETSPAVPPAIETVFLQLAQGQFFDSLAAELESDGWLVERLDLSHLACLTHPHEIAEAILRHA